MQVALTIAGSDSGGGAGIQADLKSFARFGVFGASAITAITAQNTLGVTAWEPVAPDLVHAQIEAVFQDLAPAAVKTGMLGDATTASTVVAALNAWRPPALVVDPVMVATSGDLLLRPDAVEVIRAELIPLARIVTPNLDEARVLTGDDVSDESGMRNAARRIVREMGAQAALVKGGHLAGDDLFEVYFDGEWMTFRSNRIASRNTHGTGCTLSAAIAANLALGATLRDAVEASLQYVRRAIESAPNLGSGHGPLNHFA